jgi:adenylate kinase family enzyme
MVRLKRITISAFRSFLNEETVEFSGSGLWGVRGYNHDTGGSSGAGKSTLGYAIAYALGFCPYAATELQSNLTEEPMRVSLELETDEGIVVINRGKTNSVKTPTKTVTSAKAIQEKIKELVGLPQDFLAALTFHQQGEPGTFLSMTDSHKKEFLSQLLGLEEIEDQIEAATKSYKTLEEDIGKLDASLSVLAPLLVLPEPVKQHTDELVRDEISELSVKIDKNNQSLKGWESLLHKYSNDYWANRKALESSQANDLQALKGNNENIRSSRIQPDVSKVSPEEIELRAALNECERRLELERKRILSLRHELAKKILANSNDYNYNYGLAENEHIWQEEILDYEAKISKAKERKCPTCKQEWTNSNDQIAVWNSQVEALLVKVQTCLKARGVARELSEVGEKLDLESKEFDSKMAVELQRLMETRDNIQKLCQDKETKRFSVLVEWKSRIALEDLQLESKVTNLKQVHQTQLYEMEKTFNADSAGASAEYNEAKELNATLNTKLTELQSSFKNIATNNDWAQRNYLEAKRRYDETASKIHALELQKIDWSTQLSKEKDFVAALKSFLGAIFDEVLAEISVETNELLKQVPNVATTVVQFTSEKITGKGVAKQEIRPIIIKSGKSIPLKAGLSGGQFTSVDLAVDLAVGIVVSQRTSKTPGWLILDESFDGHDVPVKEACLAMLKKAAGNRLIIIIDHASEVKDMFDAYVDVESRNDISWVKH